MMSRCASASAGVVTSRVGPVASVRRTSPTTCDGCALEMKSLRMPTSGSPRSWKPHAERTSKRHAAKSLDNDVHQSPRNDDDFLRLLSAGELLHRLVRHRGFLDLRAARLGGPMEVAPPPSAQLGHQLA